MDTFKEIRIGVVYMKGEQPLEYFPSSVSELQNIRVEYLTLPGWETSIENVRKYDDLPANAKRYVETIQGLMQVSSKFFILLIIISILSSFPRKNVFCLQCSSISMYDFHRRIIA